MVAVKVEDEKVVVEVEVNVTSVDVVVVDVVEVDVVVVDMAEDVLIDDHVCFGTYHQLDFDLQS